MAIGAVAAGGGVAAGGVAAGGGAGGVAFGRRRPRRKGLPVPLLVPLPAPFGFWTYYPPVFGVTVVFDALEFAPPRRMVTTSVSTFPCGFRGLRSNGLMSLSTV